jgi:type IV secretion system protein VirB4
MIHLAPRQVGPKAIAGIAGLFIRQRIADVLAGRIEELQRAVGVLKEELKEYRPHVLRIVRRGRALFSEIAEAVAFAMTGYWRAVPLTTGGASSVFNEAFIIGRETFEIRMPHGSAWGACLDMAEFPFMTSPGMFDRLLSASYRHTAMHAWRYMPAADGLVLATRQQNKMRVGGDRAIDQVCELTQATNLIASNRLAMGEYAHALTVFTDDRQALGHVIEQALGDLSAGGAKARRCSWALEGVLFSTIPCNFHLRGRHAAVSSRNFAAFAAMHNFPAGDRRGFWGDPVMMFRTSGGTPFLYHFQHEGSGNTFMSGQTRSGKSTTIGLMLCQAERVGAQILLWDKDRGLEALIRALDGAYLSLTVPTGLAPLKRLTDSPDDLTFLSGLLRACIATPEPYSLTPEEDRRLGIALRTIMRLAPEDRRLEEVRAFLGTDRSGAGARLEKWCSGAEFGGIIDCEQDIVDLGNPVVGFDQSALIDDPIAAGAVMATLFHYTGKLVDGRRLLIVLDEVWNALRIPQFQYQIRNGLKTFGKYNSPLIIATQEVSDGLDSAIGDTIRQQCPVQLHFANPGAHWKDYGPGGLNMTETEFDIVRTLAKGTGHFLLRQGVGRSCVLQAPLAGLDEVKVISGTRRGLDALALARKRTGDATGLPLVEAYHIALAELEEA